MKDLKIYKDIKQNEKCPCGSGKVFKKCCMKEYRELKVKSLNVLTKQELNSFGRLYEDLLIFSHSYKKGGIGCQIYAESMMHFIIDEREFFYNNCKEVIADYKRNRTISTLNKEFLQAIEKAIFKKFYVTSYDDESVTLLDEKFNSYLVYRLSTPFTKLFKVLGDKKYFKIESTIIPFRNKFILDGVVSIIHDDSTLQEKIIRKVTELS
jgi:hypothetical protein